MKNFIFKGLVFLPIFITSLFGFTIDGIESGTRLGDFASSKWKVNADGTMDIMTGKTNLQTEMLYGEPKGNFYGYDTKILGYKARVYLWVTKEKQKLYAARIVWFRDNVDLEKDVFQKAIVDALSKKYGKAKILKRQGGFTYSTWAPDKHTKIMADYKMNFFVNYIDTELRDLSKKEEKSALNKSLKNEDKL